MQYVLTTVPFSSFTLNAFVRPSICEATKSTLVVRVPVLEERVSTELVRD